MNIRFYNAKILILKEDESLSGAASAGEILSGESSSKEIFSIEEGELWVQDDRICYIGAAPAGYFEHTQVGTPMIWSRQIDCEGNLLMPGFKNAHAHTYMTFLRNFADDLPLQDWLYQICFPLEDHLNTDNIRPLELLGIMEYLAGGVTSSFDMCYFPPVMADVAAQCGFRSVQVSGVNSFGGDLGVVEENYLRVNERSPLTSFLIGFHAEYTTQLDMMEGIARLAEKYKSPVFLHNAETAKETTECVERWGKTPTQLTDALGMYTYGGGGFHCIYFDDKDLELYKDRGLYAVSCPASNLKLASGILPLKRFLEAGIPVALGTDGAASNNRLDMFREMYLASVLAKVREGDAACISADRILHMATVQGARAMQLPECDRLAPGKKADLILVDLAQPNMQPPNNLIKSLVYSAGTQNVKLTMVDGKILYEDGTFFIGADPKDIYREAEAFVQSLQ